MTHCNKPKQLPTEFQRLVEDTITNGRGYVSDRELFVTPGWKNTTMGLNQD